MDRKYSSLWRRIFGKLDDVPFFYAMTCTHTHTHIGKHSPPPWTRKRLLSKHGAVASGSVLVVKDPNIHSEVTREKEQLMHFSPVNTWAVQFTGYIYIYLHTLREGRPHT